MRSSSTSGEKGTEFTFSVSLNMNCLSYLKIKETEEFKQFALRETGTTSSDTVSTSISKDKKDDNDGDSSRASAGSTVDDS